MYFLGQEHGRLLSSSDYRQLGPLLQMMGNCLADQCGILSIYWLEMKYHQYGQGHGIES
ncbi:hypothetical protein PseBG33_4233 [Pseudomonas synxantha BG33R]|nr:hypothetical protein PseBG33_4233 [Pseudomonas synxantha BG33R]